jgi:hypothetical protein
MPVQTGIFCARYKSNFMNRGFIYPLHFRCVAHVCVLIATRLAATILFNFCSPVTTSFQPASYSSERLFEKTFAQAVTLIQRLSSDEAAVPQKAETKILIQ